jgi:8-oxo-dGTP pyrophosphatase MutT (NUDIX family)
MGKMSAFTGELQRLYANFGTPIVANFELDETEKLQVDDFAVHGYTKNRKNEILLVKHRGHGDHWLPPGGHPNPGERSEEAIVREILEETGLSCKVCGFLAQIWLKTKGTRYVLLFFDLVKQSGKLEICDIDRDIVDARFFRRFPENHMYELDKVILAASGYDIHSSPKKVESEYEYFRAFTHLSNRKARARQSARGLEKT